MSTAQKNWVVVSRDGDVLGHYQERPTAAPGVRVVNLADYPGFEAAAASAGDLGGAWVASYAGGATVGDIARHYRGRMGSLYERRSRPVSLDDARHVVATYLRDELGSLSRRAARRVVAEMILEGVQRGGDGGEE